MLPRRDAIPTMGIGDLQRIKLIRLAGIRKSVRRVVKAHQSSRPSLSRVLIYQDVIARLQSGRHAEQFAEQYLQDVGIEQGALPVPGRYAHFGVVEVGIGQVAYGRIGIRPVVAVAHAFVGEIFRTQQRTETARGEGIGASPRLGGALGGGVDPIAAVSVG